MMDWFWISQQTTDGIVQMALDEALLDWLAERREQATLVVRTYQWAEPTLSLGVHQQDKESAKAYAASAQPHGEPALVRRPTGGRAILHGQDVSFAFVTNHPQWLRLSLDESYCLFTAWVKAALSRCGVDLHPSCTAGKRDYVRSALCFETQTPSDLLDLQGRKIAGSAQLRRQHGILQHGAAFLAPYGIPPQAFDSALQAAIQDDLELTLQMLTPQNEPILRARWQTLQQDYHAEAEQTRSRLAMTSGSHLLPASD